MQNFVRVLAENHRLLLLPEIAAHYEALRSDGGKYRRCRGGLGRAARCRAIEQTASRRLSTRLKRQVRMHNSVDAALLGGAVVRAGDLVIDGSLKGRLERLATNSS